METDTNRMHVGQVAKIRQDRREAFDDARTLLIGTEHESTDILIVADWLLSGTADLALRFEAQRARNYTNRNSVISPDAAVWSSESAEKPHG